MMGTTLVIGVLSLLPFLKPSQFTALSTCNALIPIVSWTVFFRLRRNHKTFPEVKDTPANARFVVGGDGKIVEVKGVMS